MLKFFFTIPAFYGRYDAEEYLDWEMTVEQKFASHLVPDHHKVRQDTSEFKDFAIIWWQECASLNIQPDSWDALKIAMRDRFVPASYKRDLRKKLQRLEQGDMSVQDYYAELQKVMIRCGVVEDPEGKFCRFYAGLKCEIQDIVDYKPVVLACYTCKERIAGTTTKISAEQEHLQAQDVHTTSH
jgi:hypothetical protein